MGEWVDGQGYVIGSQTVTEDQIDEYAREERIKERRDRRNEVAAGLAIRFGLGLLTIAAVAVAVAAVWALIDWLGIWAVLVPVGLLLAIALVIGIGMAGARVARAVANRW